MNRRMLARAGSLALIVLSTTSTATDCERATAENSGNSSSRSGYQVDVRAADDVCWKVSMDGRDSNGCGDATFYGHRSSREARVERVDGDGSVRVTLRSGGRTADRQTIASSGGHVHLSDQGRNDRNTRSSSWRDRQVDDQDDDQGWRSDHDD